MSELGNAKNVTYHIKDLASASSLIMWAINNGIEINVVTDYDVDGASSTALFVKFFKAIIKC